MFQLFSILLFTLIFTQTTHAKEWTMLIFMNGHNNLDLNGHEDLNEMEEVGSSEHLDVVVQWASLRNGKTQRVHVEKDNDPNNVTSKVVETLPVIDMGNKDELVNFVKWGVANYPAEKYMVVIWNHGNGWHGLNTPEKTHRNWDISMDDLSGNSIDTLELGQAVHEISQYIGKKIDILGTDACLMGGIEVAAEVYGMVDSIVFSEDVEPVDGWPYNDILHEWTEGLSAEQVSKLIVSKYAPSYQMGSQGTEEVSLSAVKIDSIPYLIDALSELGILLSDRLDSTLLNQIISEVIKFDQVDYVDIIHFTEILKQHFPNDQELLSAINNVQMSMQSVIIANLGTEEYQNAFGLTVWIPETSTTYANYISQFNQLSFAARSSWANWFEGIYGFQMRSGVLAKKLK